MKRGLPAFEIGEVSVSADREGNGPEESTSCMFGMAEESCDSIVRDICPGGDSLTKEYTG